MGTHREGTKQHGMERFHPYQEIMHIGISRDNSYEEWCMVNCNVGNLCSENGQKNGVNGVETRSQGFIHSPLLL